MSPARSVALLLDQTFRSKPLLFLVLAWMAGIGLADRWGIAPAPAGAAGLALAAAAVAMRQRGAALVSLFAAVACLGLAATRLALTPTPGDISVWAGRQVAVAGIIDSEPTRSCDRWRCLLSCQTLTYGDHVSSVCGHLSLSTQQDLSLFEPGDVLLVSGVPERPSPARNPGGFSNECWLARHGAFASLSARPGSVVLLQGTGWDWRRWAARLRHHIADANRRAMADPEAAALVNSILFGDHDPGDVRSWSATEERFRRAGVIHVLVVSGAQVALLFSLLSAWRRLALHSRRDAHRQHWRLLRFTGGYSYRWALFAGLALLVPYVLLVGLQPSILRPTLVVAIFFAARCLDRESDPENSLAAAALLILVANPLTIYDLGFQFSFAAVWGILRWTSPLASLLRLSRPSSESQRLDDPVTGGSRSAGAILAMTLAAQLAITPLQAHQFQTLSLIAPVSNLFIIVEATILLPVGLISSVLNAIVLPFHAVPLWFIHCANWPSEQLARLINVSVEGFAMPSWATIPVFPPSWMEVAVIAGLLLITSTPVILRRRALSVSLLGLAVAVFVIAILRSALPVSVPTLTFIDVGQGDACLIRLPGGASILVDGGGSPRAPCGRPDCSNLLTGYLAESIRTDCLDIGRDILAGYLRHERIRRIDLMVLTHPHDDHLWGLDALLAPGQRFTIGKVLDGGFDSARPFASPAYWEWRELLRRSGLTPVVASKGMQLTVGPARLEVLSPPQPFLTHTGSDENNNSIVLRMDVAGSRVLLTGDAESAAERAMVGADVQADVLKAGHHGSATSSGDAWLNRVRPRIAVISCGRHNPFGHPSTDTLKRLQQHGIQVYRTDQNGAITLERHPEGWTATTMIDPPQDANE